MPDQPAQRGIRLYGPTITFLAIVAAACAGAPTPGAEDEPTASEPPAALTAPAETPSAPAETTPPDAVTEVDPCSLLKDAEVRGLAGKRLSSRALSDFAGIPQCRWGTVGGIVVQVQAAPSVDWGASIEAVMEQLETTPNLSAKDATELEKAQQLLAKSGTLNAEQACAVFSVIAEIGGAPKGATHIVQYLPVGGSVAVSGQQCTGGRFTSVTFQKPSLRPSAELAGQVRAALSVAHRRAVTAGR